MTKCRILDKADISFDQVILLVAGMTMLMTGFLLFPVSAGILPYYENGLYGLLLFIFALQMVTLGKTPFGDMRRSKLLLAVGAAIASVGIVTCFVPEIFNQIPRILLFLCFGPGGILLLLQMFFLKDKFRSWIKHGEIFRKLIFSCSTVYVLSVLIGLLIWKQDLLTTPITAVVVLIYGAAIVYLAAVLQKIYYLYPEAERKCKSDIELSDDRAMILLTGIFMVLLGVLLIPVTFGMLPFSGSAQLGLLMVIMAIQMLAFGNTPVGASTRSWLVVFAGLLFAALGIVSCIIPEILVSHLTFLIGVLNILSGVISLGKMCISFFQKAGEPRGPIPTVLVKLYAAQLTMNLLSIMFGTSMIVSDLIPGAVIGVILAANGGVLLYLLHILALLDKMQGVKIKTA